jgi:hypothetical protein
LFAGTAMASDSLFDIRGGRLLVEPGALTTSGPSGALTIPGGGVLPDGTLAFGFTNAGDVRFAGATRFENYLFAIGLFPYVEFSGRLANFSVDSQVAWTGFLARDLSANLKVSLPKFFRNQPDIAFGMNDLGGGAQLFGTKYVALSQSFGPLRATVGVARGEHYLNGAFGGVEMALGKTGFSVLAERNDQQNQTGFRYTSAPLAFLGNASVVATAQYALNQPATSGPELPRASYGLNLVIPIGKNARTFPTRDLAPRLTPESAPEQASPAALSEIATNAVTAASLPAPSLDAGIRSATEVPPASISDKQTLQHLQAALIKAGLERVRVGTVDDLVVVEYENHRYNQNEVDAVGIALGLAATLAPESALLISVATKKAGLALYETRVDREGYRQFLKNNSLWSARGSLKFRLRPPVEEGVQWFDPAEGPRGYSRVMVEPVLKSFVAQEYGLYDYSLAANIQLTVPLWQGAEFNAGYLEHLSDSKNVSSGFFSYAHLESGLKTATFNQSLWLTDRVLNVFSAGKFEYDYSGLQNETIWFVPGRDDQARFQYARIRYTDQYQASTIVNMGAFYRWFDRPRGLQVEAGYRQYNQNDRGPSLSISRWFGDVQATAIVRRSESDTFAGFQLAFPLTPRQGMMPAYTHLEGPGQFTYGLTTKIASKGGANYITRGIAEEIPKAYSTDRFLLNQGRVGQGYSVSQLSRMRDSFLLYSGSDGAQFF